MNCEQAQGLIGALVDRQIEPDESTVLEAHLAICEECRATFDALTVQDANLLRAFQPQREAAHRVAQQVMAKLENDLADDEESLQTVSAKPETSVNWISLLVATAAGFLIAVIVFQPWKTRIVTVESPAEPPFIARLENPADPPFVARVVVATGEVEVREEQESDWQVIPDLTSFRCPTSSSIRTGPDVRCELQTSEGCVIRLDNETEVTLNSGDAVEVGRGQIWCSSPENASLKVMTPKDKSSKLASLTCSSLSSMTTTVGFDGTVSVTSEDGEIKLQTPERTERLRRGESASIVGDQIVKSSQPIDTLLKANWVQSLLVRKSLDDEELAGRVDELLARIGFSKLNMLYEDEIRSLGQHAVLPLLRLVQSPLLKDDPSRRRTAMRILSDVAPSWAIPDLIELLADEDESVRFYAAHALKRLTGIDHGRSPNRWRDSIADCEKTIHQWRSWWTENNKRYPPRISPSKA